MILKFNPSGKLLPLRRVLPPEHHEEGRAKEACRKTRLQKELAQTEECRSFYKVCLEFSFDPNWNGGRGQCLQERVQKWEYRDAPLLLQSPVQNQPWGPPPGDTKAPAGRAPGLAVLEWCLLFRKISWISAGRRSLSTSSTSRSPCRRTVRAGCPPAMIRTSQTHWFPCSLNVIVNK